MPRSHAGVDELSRLDARFRSYRDTLFSHAALSLNRDQAEPEVVEQLDQRLEAFLALLTNHFLSPGAFKALEFLIRRFK